MRIALKNLYDRCWQHCVDWLRDACSAMPVQQGRRRRGSLELALRALPRISICGAIYVLLALGYGVELLLQGNWAWGVLVFCATAMIALALQRWLYPGARNAPRRLRLCSDGTARLFCRNGQNVPARILPHSLRLGRHWLLLLHTEDGRRHRLWLGPGNLPPAECAALGRWLRRPPADPLSLR